MQLAPVDSLPFSQLIAKLLLSLIGLFTEKGDQIAFVWPVWQCLVGAALFGSVRFHIVQSWIDIGLLLRKLKCSQPVSASGMCSIVSFPSLGYLAVIQSPPLWSWPPLPNTSAGPWPGGDSPVNNHSVLLYCPSKHRTIKVCRLAKLWAKW